MANLYIIGLLLTGFSFQLLFLYLLQRDMERKTARRIFGVNFLFNFSYVALYVAINSTGDPLLTYGVLFLILFVEIHFLKMNQALKILSFSRSGKNAFYIGTGIAFLLILLYDWLSLPVFIALSLLSVISIVQSIRQPKKISSSMNALLRLHGCFIVLHWLFFFVWLFFLKNGQFSYWFIFFLIQFFLDSAQGMMMISIYRSNLMSIPITEEKPIEESENILKAVVEQNPNAIVLTDPDAKIEYANLTVYELTGYEPEEVIGHNPHIFASGQTKNDVYQNMWDHLTTGQTWFGELLNKKKNGELYWESMKIVPIKNLDGLTKHYLAVKQDITVEKRLLEILEHNAHYDELTGLMKRKKYMELIEAKRQHPENHPLVFILFDVDRFKGINDDYGHYVGDQALMEISVICRTLITGNGYISRFGGDEFSLFLFNLSKEGSTELMAKLQKQVSQTAIPIRSSSRIAHFEISIGATIVQKNEDIVDTFLRADKALYEAKNNGKNQLVWH